jgi:hypothetical protein
LWGLVLTAPPASGQSDEAEPGPENDESMEEVRVIGRRQSDYTVITEDARVLVETPGALGDPLLAVFSLPGVVSSGGAIGRPAVRGSSPADNRYLVDGIPAGYVFHAFSTSIFNENIIRDFDLYSAGFGPEYGNATGAVFDIRLRRPRNQAITTTVDASFLRSGVFVEGGVTERSAFYLSARASLMHHFIDEDELDEEEGIRVQTTPRDSDYQFKYAWRIGERQTLTLNANGARDRAGAELTERSDAARSNPDLQGDAEIRRGFDSQSIQWRADFANGAEAGASIGRFSDRNDNFWGEGYYADTRYDDNLLKLDGALPVSGRHTVSAGTELHEYRYDYDTRQVNFVCTEFDPDCELRREGIIRTRRDLDYAARQTYLNDHWEVTDALALDLGMQWQYNDYTDERFSHPRAALAWTFKPRWTLTLAGGAYNRFSDIETVLPELGNPALDSPEADHYTLGVKHRMDNRWSWNLEFYRKTMANLPLATDPDAPEGAPLYTNNVTGEARGVDLLINKGLTDRWHGWLAFSYAQSRRTNELTGETADYHLDTPLLLNLVASYRLGAGWDVGVRATVRSGQAYTPIEGIQENPYFDEGYLPVYGEPYSERLPTYRRLDVRFSRELTLFGYDGQLTFDVLNALHTRNVLDRELDYERVEETGEVHVEESVSMGIFPSVGLSLTF